MADTKFYSLPELPYAYDALAPQISEAQLRLHHDKHHAAYVNGANAILEKLDKARPAGTDVDMKATLKELSFQVGGHKLHSLFWMNLAPSTKTSKEPGGVLADVLKKEFGSIRALQEGIHRDGKQCGGLRLGGSRLVHAYPEAASHADREA